MGLESTLEPLRTFWNDWDLRLMVLVSLAFQVILMFLGNRRKFSPKVFIRVVVWCAYISADSIAGVSLGILSSKLGEINKKSSSLDDNSKLVAFWAPSLLLLLGGPDTITAYSLEDNELWLRHLLGLVVQTVVTLYIYFMAWSVSYLSLLSSLMIIAGLIKFCERVWVLWKASSDKLRDSMLDPPDPSPVYHRFMEEYTLKQAEGYHVTADEVVEIHVHEDLSTIKSNSGAGSTEEELHKAYHLFLVFRRLFVDLILSEDDKHASLSIFKNRSWESAFKVVEIELSFMYDVLHTKAMVLYNQGGTYRRLVTLSITCFVLVFFCYSMRPQKYHAVDLALTLTLLIVVILMDVYSIFILFSSDWMGIWIEKNDQDSTIRKVVTRFQHLKQPRWSNSMGQFSLLSFCIQEKRLCCRELLKMLNAIEKVEKYHNTDHEAVPDSLKQSIFGDLMEKFGKGEHIKYDHRELTTRVLDGYNSKDLTWSTQLEFDESILVWHIATELCYYTDEMSPVVAKTPNLVHSRLLSRYMFYLLVMYPFMLPSGIGQIRLRDTIAEAIKFFKEKKLLPPQKRGLDGTKAANVATELLLKVNTQVPPSKVKGGRSKSVLFDGCRLAAGLNKKSYTDIQQKWEMISKFWVEILLCAANQCRGERHARQLHRGGELITHVWIMMAHYGFTDHFQMTQGHAIAKLILR